MKRTPLPAHDFPDEPNEDGDRPCQAEGCTTVWKAAYDDPPPWGCIRSKLSRTGSLDRSTPLSPVSDSNSGREHQKDEAFREYVRSLPCLVCEASPPSEACHYRSWGAGHGDRENLWPGCRVHHQQQHDIGVESFQEEHGIDLDAETERIYREYRVNTDQTP